MRYLIFMLALFTSAAFARVDATGTTHDSGNMEDCGADGFRTNCNTSLQKIQTNCTPPTQRNDDSDLEAGMLEFYVVRAVDFTAKTVVERRYTALPLVIELVPGTYSVSVGTLDSAGQFGEFTASESVTVNAP